MDNWGVWRGFNGCSELRQIAFLSNVDLGGIWTECWSKCPQTVGKGSREVKSKEINCTPGLLWTNFQIKLSLLSYVKYGEIQIQWKTCLQQYHGHKDADNTDKHKWSINYIYILQDCDKKNTGTIVKIGHQMCWRGTVSLRFGGVRIGGIRGFRHVKNIHVIEIQTVNWIQHTCLYKIKRKMHPPPLECFIRLIGKCWHLVDCGWNVGPEKPSGDQMKMLTKCLDPFTS